MPAPVYATFDQLDEFADVDLVQPAAERQLRRASRAVDAMLKGAVYDVGPDEMPTDPEVALLLAEATALQVEYFEETGDTSGAGSVHSGGSIGSVTLPSASRSGAQRGSGRHSPEVIELLRESPLLSWEVRH